MSDAAHHARRSRKLMGVVLAAVVVLVVPLTVVSAAQGAPPPTATRIEILSLSTAEVEVPATPGTPDYYVVAGRPFELTLEFYGDIDGDGPDDLLPLSYAKDVRLEVAVVQDGVTTTFRHTVNKGLSLDKLTGTLREADLDSSLSVRALVRPDGSIAGDQIESFEVLISSVEAPEGASFLTIGGGGALGSPCDATPDDQVCADLLLPSGVAESGALLSLGLCDSELCRDELVQVLVGLTRTAMDTDPDSLGYENPATLVMRCDKTLCSGGGIKSYNLSVNLDPDDDPVRAPDCPAKGVVGDQQNFCVDYVQSTRSNAGDTFLYLLFVVDAKVRFS